MVNEAQEDSGAIKNRYMFYDNYNPTCVDG
jgi:hypothetical protein